jgi:hypothetical protein
MHWLLLLSGRIYACLGLSYGFVVVRCLPLLFGTGEQAALKRNARP